MWRKNEEVTMVTIDVDASGATVRDVRDWPGWVFRLDLCREHRDSENRPIVSGFSAKAPQHDHPKFDSTTLREFPFGMLRRTVLGEVAEDGFLSVLAADIVPTKPYSRKGPAHWGRVATIYRFALDQGVPPREAVAQAFETSLKTASRWLAAARQAGVLGSYEDEREESRRRAPAPPGGWAALQAKHDAAVSSRQKGESK